MCQHDLFLVDVGVRQYKEKIIAIYRSEDDYLLTFRGRPYMSCFDN